MKTEPIEKGLYSEISSENIIVETTTRGPRSKQNRGKAIERETIDSERKLIKEKSSKDEKEKSESSSESYGLSSELSFNVDVSKKGEAYIALVAACKAGSLATRRVAAEIGSPISDIS
ncbi:hypothetical protein RhiirA1_477371 [Rhizophagus irregularis]|uniref:Uncharacterized protein n=1 Tax=Rhizophagus irregularis TaxID=588596 RepID=A0A2N0QTK0_9GLOM|nr:hypothetical protein RhiirA1_477371 [Rhizophagus irregularis]